MPPGMRHKNMTPQPPLLSSIDHSQRSQQPAQSSAELLGEGGRRLKQQKQMDTKVQGISRTIEVS